MAITFASGDFISLSIDPQALFFRMRTTQTTTNVGLGSRHNTSGSQAGYTILLNNAANKMSLYGKAGSDTLLIATSTSVNDGNWKAVGINLGYDNVTQNQIYIDGALDVQGLASASWGGTSNPVRWGRVSDTFWGSYIGDLAEIGMWSSRLTADEMAELGKGYSPAHIRPSALLAHINGIRAVQDVRGNALTTSGLSVADHPRVL